MAALPTHGALAQKPLSESITASSVNKPSAPPTLPCARSSNSCCCTATGSSGAALAAAAVPTISSATKHLTANELNITCPSMACEAVPILWLQTSDVCTPANLDRTAQWHLPRRTRRSSGRTHPPYIERPISGNLDGRPVADSTAPSLPADWMAEGFFGLRCSVGRRPLCALWLAGRC